ncbi:MAG: hypothetical protein NW223_14615 [Hyphomicrobiaceae bacterium]|nr:hypothetical protein [Hyphomicrobiaceae bacterium]
MLRRSSVPVLGLAFVLTLLGNVAALRAQTVADVSCSNSCKAQYGSCYKSSQDRAKCQSQLQRCLEACIRKKR